ncbi:tetraspanin-10 [Physcomitrium patens]|uniref:Uncharacterized protein n=1 Tax=Physcomitrium patens TaxID=3218 RepID=A9TQE7_PHYPA|nr:tetraspanin-10-like [Physcomitrium patens]XP_024372516.1 tetraspanin-10-like [Physcomitrium patens]XP_024372517.1 tetraspanin-10-like [Physcomitrium patens]XP_024372518.1 tetraspanin-10-like [Physcomitrium patens]PNR54828.1 hypothetical protein PHYPA_005721 [Physcomitrium patens]|eukprot:XP_024372515.1 tetraspanin-10-like [Physcomitrella patens]
MDTVYVKSGQHVRSRAVLIAVINVIAVLAALALISLGIWLATRPGDCEKYLTVPVFLLGAFFLLVAVLGVSGSWFGFVPVLYTYLVLMFVVALGFLALSIFIFAVTSPGQGYYVAGQNFKEYRISDYSQYMQDRLDKVSNWNHLKAVIASHDTCAYFDNLSPVDYPYAQPSPVQSGCCRPPAECGYAYTGNGTFTTTSVPLSANPDCVRYTNDETIKCYDCDSCKGGVAEDLRKTGKIAGIVTLVLFVILVAILLVACTVGHHIRREYWSRV